MSSVLDRPASYLTDPSGELGVGYGRPESQTVTGYSLPALRMSAVPYRVVTSHWFQPVVARFEETLGLASGWDSYSALPTTAAGVEDAIQFLASFLDDDSAPPAVVPLSDGGIQLEWHRGGLDVEATFPTNDAAEVFIRDNESGEELELTLHAALAEWRARQYASRLQG